MPEPLYKPEDLRDDFLLRWSLAIVPNLVLPDPAGWFDRLAVAVERDDIRLLDVELQSSGSWLFLLSTTPDIRPSDIFKPVKGRWQRLLKLKHPQPFRQTFSLTSAGDTSSEFAQNDITGQVAQHVATARQPQQPDRCRLSSPEVDLSEPRFFHHGRYVVNLHLVLDHATGAMLSEPAQWATTREMLCKAAARKRHRLSEAGIVQDRLHMFVGIGPDESPQEVALSYLNNLAYAHGMQRVYAGCSFMGTIGPADLQTIQRRQQ